MELFGIAFSISGALVASAIYRFLLLIVRSRWPWVKPMLLVPSYVVLAAIVVEWVLLSVRGAVGTRGFIGSAYYPLHALIFLLGIQALINVLVLPKPSSYRAQWWFALPLCSVLALILVLQQYWVSESLYGIDGKAGRSAKIRFWSIARRPQSRRSERSAHRRKSSVRAALPATIEQEAI